jgi:Bacterial PH domain
MTMVWLFVPCCAACGVLALLAWLSSRTTQYTITSRRIIMQFGIALPMTLNIPFRIIGAAALRPYADGSGDIPIAISGNDRIAYLMLWPHVRPWRAARTEPMLRSVDDAKHVSEILARAVVAAANATGVVVPRVAENAAPDGAGLPPQPVGAAA